jgi:hypothetical protein
MTAMATPAQPARTATLRPVPWRGMAWVSWRQHRAALAGLLAVLGLVGLYLYITGLHLRHDVTSYGEMFVANGSGKMEMTPTAALLQVLPALIGAFVGAPVLARELETGTFRYTWTQGVGRLRWAVAKVVLLAVAVTAVAGAFTVLFAWYNQPWAAAGYVAPFSARTFDLLGVVFAAWTLAAFAIGVLAGMLIRRAVPAIAATLAVYAALAFTTGLWLRERYISPLVTSSPSPPGASWAISGWYTKGGKFAFGDHGSGISRMVRQICGGPCRGTHQDPAQLLAQRGYTHWISYQPTSRFWTFQWIEAGWLLVLSALLIAVAVWLVRRRAA